MDPLDGTTTPTRGISRVESKGTTGWLARFYAPHRVVSRLFSDSRYGHDPDRSHAAACHWLQACLDTLEPRPRYRRSPLRSNTGHVGICLTTKTERNGRVVWVYNVTYTLEGRRRTKSFRVHLYPTPGAAFTAAQTFRRAMERAMQRERRAALRQAWT